MIFLSLISGACWAGSQDVGIQGVGISANSKTIWINIVPELTSGPCPIKGTVRLPIEDSIIAKEVYSAALTALAASKTVTVGFNDAASCIHNSHVVQTFYIKK